MNENNVNQFNNSGMQPNNNMNQYNGGMQPNRPQFSGYNNQPSSGFKGNKKLPYIVGVVVLIIVILILFFSVFKIEIDSVFIAAILTIIGYSINNTIVVFDRIRENKTKLYKDKIKKIDTSEIQEDDNLAELMQQPVFRALYEVEGMNVRMALEMIKNPDLFLIGIHIQQPLLMKFQ